MEAHFRRQCAGRDVMGSAKSREEVVESELIGDVNRRKAQAPFKPVSVEKIVITEAEVEKIARCNALWIVIIIFSSRRGNFY